MADLSHWIYANDFTAHEAAYLILGVDPSTDTDSRSAKHVKERLQQAYEGALESLKFEIFVEPCFSDNFFYEKDEQLTKHKTLKSVAMYLLLDNYVEGDEVSLSAWLNKGRNNFLEQRFSRTELARWITENKLVSQYSFAANQLPESPIKPEVELMEKPLTTRERDVLLTIIAVLCKEAKLDYTKHSKTAGLIQSTAASMGVSIGETTIENHLKKIPDALASRMK